MFAHISYKLLFFTFFLLTSSAVNPLPAMALGVNAELANATEMKSALSEQKGKIVTVKLASGQDLSGQVERVGTNTVHLSKISGQESSDALVRIDHVSALLVKAREE